MVLWRLVGFFGAADTAHMALEPVLQGGLTEVAPLTISRQRGGIATAGKRENESQRKHILNE